MEIWRKLPLCNERWNKSSLRLTLSASLIMYLDGQSMLVTSKISPFVPVLTSYSREATLGEANEEELSIHHYIALHEGDDVLASEKYLSKEEILPDTWDEDLNPDKEELEEDTGNEGATI